MAAGTKNLEFAAQVDAWTRKTEQRMVAVFRQSAQDVISTMQTPVGAGGNMPIVTGFLRASLRASTEEMPSIDPNSKGSGAPIGYDEGEITMVIASAEIGDTIFAGYTANYAGFMEFGTSNIAPRAFVRLAAAQWPAIVQENIGKAKERASE